MKPWTPCRLKYPGGKFVKPVYTPDLGRNNRCYEAMRYSNEKPVKSLDILKTASVEARHIRDKIEEEMQSSIDQLGLAVADTSERKK